MRAAFTGFWWIVLVASCHAAKVSFTQTSQSDSDGSVIGAVSSSDYLDTGVPQTSVAAPPTFGAYRFTHWTCSAIPAGGNRDAWGRSLNPVSLILQQNTTATAHYLPESRDSDGDGLPDWYEIEYFGNLTRNATSDSDGDGVTLLVEYTAGTSPLHGNSSQAGSVGWADSSLVTCNLAGYASYTLRSVPAGTVNQSYPAAPGSVITVPDLAADVSFAYWTLDGVRQQDAWGRALSVFSFTMGTTNREAVAYLLTGDSDGDGLPDAYEQRYYGTLANNAASDTDGDGASLLAEYTAGTSPLYRDAVQEGGVAWADSGLITCNLAGYATYTLRSVPAGTVNQSTQAAPDAVITVPDLADNGSFAYWTLDGVRQQDAWGRALSTFRFTMTASNREAVAYLLDGDSDGDNVPDAYEQRYYGSLANNAVSDTDGDGAALSAEYVAGTSPIFRNAAQDGGVAWVDSGLVTADLQADIAVDHPSGYGIADGGTHRFGDVAVGANLSHTLVIRNPGGKDLTGLGITLGGADATMFSITATPTAPLPHNGTTRFTVRFAPTSAGAKTATLQIASNDVDENPFDVILTGNEAADSPFVAWINAANLPVDLCGPMHAPYGDGVVNLQKFAFNLDPTKPDSRHLVAGAGGLAGLPVVTRAASGRLRLEFIRRKASGNPGLAYRAEFSSDLADWVNLIGLAVVTSIDETWERLVVEDVPPPGARDRFARVSVSMNPDGTVPETPFSLWMAAAGVPSDLAGATQSPQQDGVPNLVKFAFNLDPTRPDLRHLAVGANRPVGLPGMVRVEGKLRIEFVRRKAATNPGITYTPQFSSTLNSWTDFTGPPTSVTSMDQTWERVVVDDPQAAGSAARFGRLKISEMP